MFIHPAFAQAAASADPVAAGSLRVLFQFLVIFGVFYIFLIRPQQKKLKEHQCMQLSIVRGDTVVTSGGIVGKVIRSNLDELLIEIADGVRVTVLREKILKRKTTPSQPFTDAESVNDNTKKGSEGLKDILTKK